jgi:hypothetical protein
MNLTLHVRGKPYSSDGNYAAKIIAERLLRCFQEAGLVTRPEAEQRK